MSVVSEKPSPTCGELAAALRTTAGESSAGFLLQAARPGFWLTSIWFYLLPLAQQPIWNSWKFWAGLAYVTFPLGLLIYGWNDIVDAENDRRNVRKGTFLFGAKGSDRQLRMLPRAIAIVHLPLLIFFLTWGGWRMLLWYAALIGATAIYNFPRHGLKNLPVVDMLNQAGYLLVFYLSSAINAVPQLPAATWIFGVMFAMHSHLLGQIMDFEPDRLAGRRTTAGLIGVVRAKWLLALFLLSECGVVLWAFQEIVIGGFLAAGAILFLIDAIFVFRERGYPNWMARLFLTGWNVAALASGWYVWSTAALSR